MPNFAFCFVSTALLASLAAGQNSQPAADRVLPVATADSPQRFQEIVNTIRAISGLSNVVADPAQKSIRVRGSAEQVDLAEWVRGELDQPAASSADYQIPGGQEIARVFFLAHVTSPVGLQEIVNGIRSITEIVRIMPDNTLHAIIVRGEVDRVSLAAWLIGELDLAPGGRPTSEEPREFRVTSLPNEATRVFYPASIQNPQQLQALINSVREGANIKRIMPNNSLRAILLRASNEQVAAAARIIDASAR